MFAIKHYDNPQCEGEKEFYDDMKRFKYIKRLLRKHKDTGVLKERLLLNHIIVLNNLFGAEACVTLLLFKIQREYWETLKSFLLFLNMIRDDELRNVDEAIMGRAIDLFVTYRFIKLLVTPFEKTEAFKLGIIDKGGKVLKKYRTLERIEERQAYTILHRLVFNIKKLIEKLPGGKSRIATYAAALFLIKEHINEYHDSDGKMLEKEFYKYLKDCLKNILKQVF